MAKLRDFLIRAWIRFGRRFVTWCRFRLHAPRLRIVVSSQLFGGIGGVERAVQLLIESSPDCEFRVHSTKFIPGGFLPKTWNYSLQVPHDSNDSYDVYYYFASARPSSLVRTFRFRTTLIDSCGRDVSDLEDDFDVVVMQSKNKSGTCRQQHKFRTAIPDMRAAFPKRVRAPRGLPAEYCLTVFNPYSHVKGADVLERTAKESRLPIVWCLNDTTFKAAFIVPNIPNVTVLSNLPQEELYYAYRNAAAYICFSRREGFGMSLAEAYCSNLPIVSRETGFIELVRDHPGIMIYETEEDLAGYLREGVFRKPAYDQEVFEKYGYARFLATLFNAPLIPDRG